MQVQVNTDDHVEGREDLIARVQEQVGSTLQRFASQVTRVEVHLSDENKAKEAGADKRCLMEVRPAGQRPIAVTHSANTLEEAWSGAARKLRNALESAFGKLDDRKGGASIRDNPLR